MVRVAPPRPIRHASHMVRGPIRNSTENGTHNAVVAAAYGWVFRQGNLPAGAAGAKAPWGEATSTNCGTYQNLSMHPLL
eukprot:7934146-Pyramimonas_sp.AAC.1